MRKRLLRWFSFCLKYKHFLQDRLGTNAMRVGKRGVMMNEIWSLVWRFRRGAMQGKMVWVSTTPIASNQSKPLPGKPFGSVRKTTTNFFPSLSIPFFFLSGFVPSVSWQTLSCVHPKLAPIEPNCPFRFVLCRVASRHDVTSRRVVLLLSSPRSCRGAPLAMACKTLASSTTMS